MSLTGLSALQLGGALAAVTVLLLALYLIRQRRPELVVPFLPLWDAILPDRQVAARRMRLRLLLSLLLALTIASALLLALADPRPSEAEPVPTLVLIDASPSMAALETGAAGGGTRLSLARAQARSLVRAAPPQTPMLVASLGQDVLPHSPLTSQRETLLRAIDAVSIQASEADLDRGLAFARDAFSAGRARIVLVSDGRMRSPSPQATLPEGMQLTYLAVGESAGNLAFTHLAVRRYPRDRDRSQTLVAFRNAGPAPASGELWLRADGTPVQRTRFELGPGETLRRTYPDLTGLHQTLTAELVADAASMDQLALDSRAVASVAPRRRSQVLCITAGNLYLQAALLLDDTVSADVVAPADYATSAGYDAVIFDGVVPPAPPDAPALYLYPSQGGAGNPLEVKGELTAPRVVRARRDHPLLRWVNLRDVNIARALKVAPHPEDQIIAAAAGGPLVVSGSRQGQRFIALTFPPEASDLPLRAAWPVLLLNALDLLQGQPQGADQAGRGYREPLVAGQPARVPTMLPAGPTRVTSDAGTARGTVQGGQLRFRPRAAGLYRAANGEAWAVQWPAQLDPHIAVRDGITLGEQRIRASPPPQPAEGPTPWVLLLGVAAGLLVFEWWTFHRRWTR